MKYTPYTFAASDFVEVSIACAVTIAAFLFIGWFFNQVYPTPSEFRDPEDDAIFAESPNRDESGISREVAGMAPGTQLVEVDTAGMLTPPQHVLVHEYRWTGSAVEHVRTVPLHEFDFLIPGSAMHAASHPATLAARADFFQSRRPLLPTDRVQL